MPRPITVMQMVKAYFELIPNHREIVSFVEYAGNMELNIYLSYETLVVYDYSNNKVKRVNVNTNYMNKFLAIDIQTERDYREVYSRLLIGRMDALEISCEELSDKCGISRSTLYRIIKKESTPSAYLSHKIESHLQNSKNDIWRFI